MTISPAVDGSCAASGFGNGFGRGTRASGAPTFARPSGAPTGPRPSGAGGSRGPNGFAPGNFATGQLSALTSTGMQVKVLDRRTNATSTDTITLTPTTTYTRTATVAATALRVGQCVMATGPANSKGAVAATRIALSVAGPDGCDTRAGFGRRGGANPSSSQTGA